MKIFITLWITMMLIWPELPVGNVGISLGIPIFGALYFYITFGSAYGIASAAGAGFILDLLYSRTPMFGAFIFVLIVFACAQTVRQMQRKMPGAALISGGICGTMICCRNFIYTCLSKSPIRGVGLLDLAVFHIFAGAVFMLLLVLLFDAVNFRCNLPRFSAIDVKNNIDNGNMR